MAIVVEATYENGVLKPERPLPLGEHEKVQVIVESEASPNRRSVRDRRMERGPRRAGAIRP